MDTRQIKYILKIAEENNITRAAEKLHLTQPALNQLLLRLERELYLQLFHRSRTDWRPTLVFTPGQGTNMFSYVYPLFHSEVSRHSRGTIRAERPQAAATHCPRRAGFRLSDTL